MNTSRARSTWGSTIRVARLDPFEFQSQPITALVPIRLITTSPGRIHVLDVCRKRGETRKVRPRLYEPLSGFGVSSPTLFVS